MGQALVLDGKPYVVAGVMPPAFQFPPFWMAGAEMWTPLRFTAKDETNQSRFLRVFARRKPGADLGQVRSEMALVNQRVALAWPEDHAGTEVTVEPLLEPVVSRVRPALLALSGAVAFVLLIAGANVTSLFMARGLGREKEVVLRAALGAGRLPLLRLLLTETLTLALLGGIVGVGIAGLAIAALRSLGPQDLPRLGEIHLDGRVLTFGLLLSLASGLFSGLAPAWRALRTDLSGALKQGERLAGSARHPLHDGLVVVQFALALVLLVGAGLLTKSFAHLLHPDPGFRTEGLLTLKVALAGSPFAEPARQAALFEEVLERARRVPGVVEVGLVEPPAGGGGYLGNALLPGGATLVGRRPARGHVSRGLGPAISRPWAFPSSGAGRSPTPIAPMRRRWCSSTRLSRAATGGAGTRWAKGSGKAAPIRRSRG